MDVILVKDVDALGKAGSLVQVKPGFARNYLLPTGAAVAATDANRRSLEARTAHTRAKAERTRQQADALHRKLEGRSLTMKLAVGEQNTPFGSVSVQDIVTALASEGLTVDKHAILLDAPVKTLGIVNVPIRLHPEMTATLKLWIVKA